MKKIFLFCLIVFIFSLQKIVAQQNVSEADLRADFKMALDWLNHVHPLSKNQPFTFEIPKKQALTQPDSLWKILAKSLKKINCGHTFAYLPNFNERKTALLSGNFWINSQDTSLLWQEKKDDICYQIVSIDKRNVKVIINEILSVSKAAPLDWKDAEEKFALYYALLFPTKNQKFTYEIFVSKDSQQKQLISVNAANYATWLSNYELRFSKGMALSYIPEYKTALLKIPDFFVEKSDFDTQMPNLLSEFDSLGINRLVIDLRENQGGSLLAAETLFSYLCADTVFLEKESDLKSLRIYDHVHLSQISARPYSVNLQNKVESFLAKNFLGNETKGYRNKDGYYGNSYYLPAKKTFQGKISVLIGNRTFSAAEHFCRLMFLAKKAKLIGNPTGGSAKDLQADIVLTYTLPKSQISIEIPLIHTNFKQITFSSFIPDIKTSDFQKNCEVMDEAMLKAISW